MHAVAEFIAYAQHDVLQYYRPVGEELHADDLAVFEAEVPAAASGT
ncbi:MAG: hypothetical protein ACLUEQ_01705 [Cloacibacillus evryensis]